MTRYHFHSEDGRCYPDKSGVELPTISAVEDQALRSFTEMVSLRAKDFWSDGLLRLIVQDETGLTLFTLEASCLRAPATQSRAAE